MKKECPSCKGDGFEMIDETPEDCMRCSGTGEINPNDLFEQMVALVTPINQAMLQAFTQQ